VTACQFECRHQCGVARRTQATPFEQGLWFGGQQAAQAAREVLQQLARYVECVRASRAGAQHHGQQLRVGKCLCAAFQETFARPLAARPGIDVAGALLDKFLIHRAIMTFQALGAELPIGRVSSISANP